MKKPLLYALHAGGAYDRLDYVVEDGVVFTRVDNGGQEVVVKAAVATPLDRTKVLRAWCRWLDDEAWGGFGPRTISVGFSVTDKITGDLIEQGETHAPGLTPSGTDTVEVRVGRDASGSYLDGNVRMIDSKRNPITGLECLWKR